MKATKNGWTVESTPREIAELIGMVPSCSLYETPEWNRIKTEVIRQEQAKVYKRLKECEELERRKEGDNLYASIIVFRNWRS